MASTQTPTNDLPTSEARTVAFFSNQNDAYDAINQLRNAGFTSSEIGLIAGSEYDDSDAKGRTQASEGFWQKVKDFFTGESHDEDYDYRETSSDLNWNNERADYYYNGINSGGALVSVTGPRTAEARTILQKAGGDLRESGFEEWSGSNRASTEGDRRIQLRGEILRTYKERVQRGEVRLRKDVITETQHVEVPVTREELVIERTPGSGRSATGEIGKDEEIRVPLSEERVRTEKQPVVNEEVRVGKRAVQSTENVSDNVRHEELRVEKDGNVDVDTDATRAGKKKKPAA
ncbi:MAG TPA: YsnF/AvaK domain-containing protein [Terriglobales bacterium]|nr:YsnF/AvaK domain-containing protein [Terriglobales bacterium]